MRPGFTIVEAPSILGLRPTGVERLPDALLSAGLATLIEARRDGRVEPPAYGSGRGGPTGIRNAAAIRAFALALADRVGHVLDERRFPVVLGGDCSILLGNLLALRRRGRFGLLFVDGHADFYQAEANVNGEAASSELAFATGRGPETLTSFDERAPLVRDEDVVVFGHRDAGEAASFGSQPLPSSIAAFDLESVRASGIDAAASRAVGMLGREDLDGFWVHVDADVLDDEIMPAVDYRQPGGLSWRELETLLRRAQRSGAAVGLDVTIFNPELDESGGLAEALAAALARGLNADGPPDPG